MLHMHDQNTAKDLSKKIVQPDQVVVPHIEADMCLERLDLELELLIPLRI